MALNINHSSMPFYSGIVFKKIGINVQERGQNHVVYFSFLSQVLCVNNTTYIEIIQLIVCLSGVFSYEVMWFRRQRRTSVPFALERRDLATRAARSTVSSLTSCARGETSPSTTAPGASPSMATSLRTKTSH